MHCMYIWVFMIVCNVLQTTQLEIHNKNICVIFQNGTLGDTPDFRFCFVLGVNSNYFISPFYVQNVWWLEFQMRNDSTFLLFPFSFGFYLNQTKMIFGNKGATQTVFTKIGHWFQGIKWHYFALFIDCINRIYESKRKK